MRHAMKTAAEIKAEMEARRIARSAGNPVDQGETGIPVTRQAPAEDSSLVGSEDYEPSAEEIAAATAVPSKALVVSKQSANGQHRNGSYLPDIHRLLPASADAEKGVISSFLNAPVEVGQICEDKLVAKEFFHIPAHAGIYEQLVIMWKERMPIDVITFTQRLRDLRCLEDFGGAAYVTDLFTFLPTAANVGYYIELLEEKHTLREIIRVSTEAASRAYDAHGDVATLIGEVQEKVKVIAENRLLKIGRDAMLSRRFDAARQPKPPVPVWTLGGAVIATSGNLMAVQAKAKAGKSALLGAMLAATMAPTGDCFTFSSENPRELAVVHFDTEQSPWDHYQCVTRALKRAGRSAAPGWLHSYCVTDLALHLRKEHLLNEIRWAHTRHGGLLAAIIDGVADLCLDPNDPTESFALVDELHQLAIRYDTLIVCVIHENPGTDQGKTRGHLGTQLERKAETNLRLEKDASGVTVIFADRSRSVHIPKERGARFSWSDDKQMHVSTEEAFTPPNRAGGTKKERGELRLNAAIKNAKASLGKYFARGATLQRSVLAVNSGLREGTFNKYWLELKQGGLIVQNPAVKALWNASPLWAAELEGDYPTEGES